MSLLWLLSAPVVAWAAEPPTPVAPADVAAPPADSARTPSGLSYKLLRAGPADGAHPIATSRVTVHYTGWTTDGMMFDSSVVRGEPATFPLNGVISGWTEGVQLMRPGDLMRMWIPEGLAYRGQAGAPAGMLVFDIELLSFVTPPPTPIDVGRVPPIAQFSPSGLPYRVLKAGTGVVHPTATDTVVMHWSGWTSAGELINSTLMRGAPESHALAEMPPEWSETLQSMVVGEKRRIWVKVSGKGFGRGDMLVYEIELVEVRSGAASPGAP